LYRWSDVSRLWFSVFVSNGELIYVTDGFYEALEKWEQRKKRVNKNKIFVICIERDGFDEEAYEAFKSISYPKVLFTRNVEWKDDIDCIFLDKYKDESQVPDIIPSRVMYYKNLLPKKIEKVFM